jgi:hypothetical protein
LSSNRPSLPAWFFVITVSFLLAGCAAKRPVPTTTNAPPTPAPQPIRGEDVKAVPQAIAPKEFPKVPPADPSGAWVAPGYRVEVVVRDLIYPTSVAFDEDGNMYVAEAGYSYGDLAAPARVWRISQSGAMAIVADPLNGPVNDIMWHQGKLYISHRGKISALEVARVPVPQPISNTL